MALYELDPETAHLVAIRRSCSVEQLAAFIDGEGTIQVNVQPCNTEGRFYSSVYVQLASIDRELIEQIDSCFPGKVAAHGKNRPKTLWHISWFGRDAEPILRAVLPHLLIVRKRLAAKVAILAQQYRMATYRGGQKRGVLSTRILTVLSDEVSRLNQGGDVAQTLIGPEIQAAIDEAMRFAPSLVFEPAEAVGG